MSREAHVRFWERAVVKFRRATRLALKASKVNAEGLRFFSAQSKKSFSDNLPSFASP